MDKPFLILTMQRSGGTNLANFLNALSPHETWEHEPFSPARELGTVTADYRKTEDKEALSNEIEKIAKQKKNFKYCYCNQTYELTHFLIEACRKEGYNIILLYRLNQFDRHISRMIMRATSVGGESFAKIETDPYAPFVTGEKETTPVSLNQFRKAIKRADENHATMMAHLEAEAVPISVVIFEDLFAGTTPLADNAENLARSLGHSEAIEKSALAMLEKRPNSHSSQELQALIPEADEIKALLRKYYL